MAKGTSTPIVVVIMSGSSVATPWAAASDRVGAIVQHFYPGVLGGEALADVLFGHAGPSARLPVMIPTSEAQLPADYLNQSMLARPAAKPASRSVPASALNVMGPSRVMLSLR